MAELKNCDVHSNSNAITIGRSRLRSASSLSLSIKKILNIQIQRQFEKCLDLLYRIYNKGTEKMSEHRVILQNYILPNKTTDAEELKSWLRLKISEVERHESNIKSYPKV